MFDLTLVQPSSNNFNLVLILSFCLSRPTDGHPPFGRLSCDLAHCVGGLAPAGRLSRGLGGVEKVNFQIYGLLVFFNDFLLTFCTYF